MADLSTREPGWYWVKRHAARTMCEIALWQGLTWDLAGTEEIVGDGFFETIGPRIYPPGEDRERDDLLSALRAVDEFDYTQPNAGPRMQIVTKQIRAALARAAS